MQHNGLGPAGEKPMCWIEDGSLLLYVHGSLYIDFNGRRRKLCDLPLVWFKRFASHNRMVSRLLRIEPRAALSIGDSVLITWMGFVLRIDYSTGKVTAVAKPREGFSNPLYFSPGDGENNVAIWGDYGANHNRQAVFIYGLKSTGNVEVLHEFASGSIRHVHGIIPRKYGDGGYYIFTGDMEDSSGIYIAKRNFSTVKPFALGEQRFRAVRGYSVDNGLVYATDSASIENHIFYLQEKSDNAGYSIEDIGVLNGPCIYGGQVNGGFVFTTTVEPNESVRGLTSYLSTALGPGVRTPEATAVLFSKDGSVREVARFRCDGMPLKAFQYGSLQIPAGVAPAGQVWAFARSLKKLDGRAVKFDLGGKDD